MMTAACPAWSIKDVFAHLAGISTDILAGNTEGAATEPWADGHVADRLDHSLAQVLAEWEKAGEEVSAVMEATGEAFPFQLFVDQWTHEWDIRAALGAPAAVVADTTVINHFFDDFARVIGANPKGADLDRLYVEVDGQRFTIGGGGDDGVDLGEVSFTMFEFARISMGRRSRRQLTEFEWPMTDIDGHVDVLVVWSVSGHDVDDPVVLTN